MATVKTPNDKASDKATGSKDVKPLSVAKITTKELGFTKKLMEELVILNPEKAIPIIRVVGTCTGAEPKSSENPDMQDSLLFRGIFKATNLLTGASYTSSKMYVPSLIQDTLGALFLNNENENSALRLGFDITLNRSKSEKGSAYSFGWQNHGNQLDNLFAALELDMPEVPDVKQLGIKTA